MDFLNQAVDVGGHDQQIARRGGTWIPIGVRRFTRHEHGRTCVGLDFLLAKANAESSFQDVPGFIVAAMKMRRGDETRWTWRTAWVAPLGNHKGIGDRTDDLPSEWRSNFRPAHGCASLKKIRRGYT